MTTPPVHDNNALAIDIEIPRLDGESIKAYESRVAYITMGHNRSLERVQQKYNRSNTKSRIGQWSSKYDWVEHAKRYDETLASLAARRKAQLYIEDVEKYQKQYKQTGEALLVMGLKLLKRFEDNINTLELTPQAMNALIRLIALSAELRANALQLTQQGELNLFMGGSNDVTLTPDDAANLSDEQLEAELKKRGIG